MAEPKFPPIKDCSYNGCVYKAHDVFNGKPYCREHLGVLFDKRRRINDRRTKRDFADMQDFREDTRAHFYRVAAHIENMENYYERICTALEKISQHTLNI